MANAETVLQQQIRLSLGARSDLRLFRNNTGTLPDPRTGRPVQFGLAKGSADLIGLRTITITPDMVGRQVAVFTSLEIKTPTGRISQEQKNWHEMVRSRGGITGFARSVQDANKIIGSVAVQE